MRYIFDSDSFTHLYKGNENVKKRLADEKHKCGLSIVTKVEVLRGRIEFLLKADNAENLEKAQRLFFESEKLIAEFPIIQFNQSSLAKFDEFRQNSKYRKIGRGDMLIASICLTNRAILVTRNVKHFKQFPNLDVENWID